MVLTSCLTLLVFYVCRSRSRDRNRRNRSRSREHRRSRSRDRRRRSKSRSKSPAGYDPERKRRRPTWFDIVPVGGAPPPIAQLPGAVQVTPFAETGPVAAAGYAGGANQQATRHARRIYVGGLPPSAREDAIASFFSNALAAVGGTTAGPGPCVVNVYINQEKKFAFVEMRTVEEASNAMALDGIMFEGVTVRIRRPADYNAAAAAPLGPSAPNPNLNLAAIGLDRTRDQASAPNAAAPPIPSAIAAAAGTSDLPASDRIFVGGLPYYLSDQDCRELLGSFGAIRTFDLIRDRATGDSKGYGFVVYDDPNAAGLAIPALHGMRMGDRQLTVRKAEGQARTAQPVIPAQPTAEGGYQPAMFTVAAPRVVKLVDALDVEELQDDEAYAEIMEDMETELRKFGDLEVVHIPRLPKDGAEAPQGLGKVVAEYKEPGAAMAARNALHGRRFGGKTVQASLVTEEDYKAGRWD